MSRSTVDVRNATAEDVDALVGLYRRAYRGNAEMGFPSSVLDCDDETVTRWLRDRRVLVATAGGDLVGAVQVIPRPDWGVPEIGRLAVEPGRQERGFGRRLLAAAEERVREADHGAVRLRTLSGHPFLEGWYRRVGYERVGVERLDARPYDAPIMEKEL